MQEGFWLKCGGEECIWWRYKGKGYMCDYSQVYWGRMNTTCTLGLDLFREGYGIVLKGCVDSICSHTTHQRLESSWRALLRVCLGDRRQTAPGGANVVSLALHQNKSRTHYYQIAKWGSTDANQHIHMNATPVHMFARQEKDTLQVDMSTWYFWDKLLK